MKHRKTIYWAAVFCMLSAYLQVRHSFLFYYLEEQQLFLFTRRYAIDAIMQPGGLALYLSRFVVQLYYLPFAGPLLLAELLVLTGVLSQSLINRFAKGCGSEMPEALSAGVALLPMLAVMVLHFDANYFMQGTAAYLAALYAVRLYLRLRAGAFRFAAGLILFPILYFAAGPVALLGGACAFLCDAFSRQRLWLLSLAYPLLIMLIGFACVRLAILGNCRMALLADMYHDPLLHPAKLLYPWYALAAAISLAWLMRKAKEPSGIVKKLSLYLFPAAVLIAFFGFVGKRFEPGEAFRQNVRQDYFLRRCLWDDIIDSYNPEKGNVQTLNVLNFALNEKGVLCDRLFEFRQAGVKALLQSWDSSAQLAMPLCDILYGVGDIASAQKLAFEGNVASTGGGNVRLLQRLVETNIICGEYKVAEKYLTMLGQTMFYRAWADGRRKFLYNDSEVARDSVLGAKRRGFVGDGHRYAVSENVVETLEHLAVNNPQERSAIHYLAAFYMLAKDAKQVRRLVDTYYGTEVLPSLPVALQEAVVAMVREDVKYFAQHGVSPNIEAGFRKFNMFVNVYGGDIDFEQKLSEQYGHTYWYYLLMYNVKHK